MTLGIQARIGYCESQGRDETCEGRDTRGKRCMRDEPCEGRDAQAWGTSLAREEMCEGRNVWGKRQVKGLMEWEETGGGGQWGGHRGQGIPGGGMFARWFEGGLAPQLCQMGMEWVKWSREIGDELHWRNKAFATSFNTLQCQMTCASPKRVPATQILASNKGSDIALSPHPFIVLQGYVGPLIPLLEGMRGPHHHYQQIWMSD